MTVLSHTNIMQKCLDKQRSKCPTVSVFASFWTSNKMTVTQGVLRSSRLEQRHRARVLETCICWVLEATQC